MFHEAIRRRRHAGFHGQAASILDADGRFLNVSPSLAAFFRRDGASMLGTRLLSCIPPDEAEQVAPILSDLAAGSDETYRFQVQLCSPDGSLSWVQLGLSPGGTDPDGRRLLVALFEEPPVTVP